MSELSRAKPLAALLRPKFSEAGVEDALYVLEEDLLTSLERISTKLNRTMTPQNAEDLERLQVHIEKFKIKISKLVKTAGKSKQ